MFYCCLQQILMPKFLKEKYINDATKIANEWLDNVINKDYGIAYSNYSNEVKANSDSTYWLQAIDQLMNEFGPFKKERLLIKNLKVI